jgi:hypothetical protein
LKDTYPNVPAKKPSENLENRIESVSTTCLDSEREVNLENRIEREIVFENPNSLYM